MLLVKRVNALRAFAEHARNVPRSELRGRQSPLPPPTNPAPPTAIGGTRGVAHSRFVLPLFSIMADHTAVLEAAQLLGCTTMWTAAAAGDVDALRPVPDRDLVRADLARGWTACQYACAFDQEHALAYLMHRGVVLHELPGPAPLWLAASSGSVNCLRLLIRVGADIDHDYDDQSPLEAACRSTAPSGLECACELIVYGAHIADGYAPSSLRPAMIAWARDRTHSHYGAVVVAMAARSGTGVDGTPSPLRRLDGRAVHIIGEFLRSPGKVVQRLKRALWVLEGEERHAAACARAAARGWQREDHCFTVF